MRLDGLARFRQAANMGWAEMYEKAARNYGVFAVRNGPDVGLTARTIRAKASREQWRQPHPGVVVLPGSIWDHRAAIAAAQEYLGERAAAGGMSAAWLYRLVPQPPPIPHLLVPHGVHVTASGVDRGISPALIADGSMACRSCPSRS